MGRRTPNSLFMTARREFERELVDRVIAKSGNKMEAARRLGISYATLKTIVKDKGGKVPAEMAPLVDELRTVVMRRIEGVSGGTENLVRFLEKVRADVRNEFLTDIRQRIHPELAAATGAKRGRRKAKAHA
jgi:hypothetical protein